MPNHHSIESLTKTISRLKQLGQNQLLRQSSMGNIVHFSRSIHFIPDYPIAPQIKTHTASQPTQIFNLIQICLVVHLGKNPHFFKMATIFLKKFKMSNISPHVVDNSHIHLNFKFHANPAKGFETIEFKTKMN